MLAVLRRMKKTTYNWGNAVSTPAPSFLNGSSSFLQVTKSAITSRMSLNFEQIGHLTAESAAL